MKFRDWLVLENILYEDDNVIFRDASPNEIPKYFMHRTDSQEAVNGIVQQGFNLRYFGKSSRKYGMPAYLQYDPKGIYATAVSNPNEVSQVNDRRPYVVFTTNITKALILQGKSAAANVKESLTRLFGGKAGSQLTQQLRKLGYQAVLQPDSEQIILDPSTVQIVRWSGNNQ